MGDVRGEARTRKKKCGEKDEDELHCWNDGGNISVKISVKNRVANPDEFSTFGYFPVSPQRGRARCNLSVGRGIAPSSTCAGWFANELNLTKGNSFTGALSIVVIQRHGRDLWTLISVEDRRIVSTNGRVRQTNCAISRGSLLPTPILLLPPSCVAPRRFVRFSRPSRAFSSLFRIPSHRSPSFALVERSDRSLQSNLDRADVQSFVSLPIRVSFYTRDVVFATNRKRVYSKDTRFKDTEIP